MKTIVEQLRAAYEETEWTMAELLEKSRLELDRSSLRRKLAGELDMKTDEAERLASTLGVTLVWPPKKTKGAAA